MNVTPGTVAITVVGADNTKRTIKDLPLAILNTRTMRGVGMLAVRSVQRGIREQKSPDGKPYPKTTRFGRKAQRLRDTGRTINSISFVVDGPGRLTFGTNVISAPTQHFGDERSPKPPKKLYAIPMTRQIARAYVAGKSLRDQYPDAFVFESKKKGLFLVRRKADAPATTKGARGLEFLFKLVPRVKIEGTHFLGLSKRGVDDILDYIMVVAKRHSEGARN